VIPRAACGIYLPMANEFVTKEFLGRKLRINPRTAAKRYDAIATLIIGDGKQVKLYPAPSKKGGKE
jgi:hypothetical protein